MSGSHTLFNVFYGDLSTDSMPPAEDPTAAGQQKKRRRPALACEQCRKRKIRCDRNSPCNHCTKANVSNCTYAPTHVPPSRARKAAAQKELLAARLAASTSSPDSARLVGLASGERAAEEHKRPPSILPQLAHSSSVPSSTGGSASHIASVDWLVSRVHQLEKKLANVVPIGGTRTGSFQQSEPEQDPAPVGRHVGTASKTRYFGQSHWMNGINLFSLEFDLLSRAEASKSEMYQVLVQCKKVVRKIKQNRSKPVASDCLGRQIPTREVADELVENYLRTFEGVLRILHVPTFRSDYERYWQTPEAANAAFVILLQLCMAIGSCLYDDRFSMRSLATTWVHEAQLWMMMPPEKSRMTIPGLQIMCLLVLSKTTCGVGQDLTWITTGDLLRKAMYMGLHRDPKHLTEMTVYRAEMRRRLWATILELNLQASFEAGGSPLIANTDYDTQLPADLDDEQLGDGPDGQAESENLSDGPTQMSIQLALLQSLPLRATLLRHVNDLNNNELYDEILRLNSELTKATRAMASKITTLTSRLTEKTKPKLTAFHISLAEMFVYRCFQALHQPVIVQSLDNPKFYFSRRMYLDSAMKLSHIWGLRTPAQGLPTTSDALLNGRADFKRLITNAAGMFRNVPVQALFIMASELIHNKGGESMSLGYLPSVADGDLRACLESSLSWTLDRIRAGETNAKGHCFTAACMAHIDALELGLSLEGIEEAILKNLEVSARRCLEVLLEVSQREGVAAETSPESEVPEVITLPTKDATADMSTGWMGDWAWGDMENLSWQQWSPDEYEGLLGPLGPMQF